MDVDSLRCFDAAATTLNFRAAAKRVHLSAAAFSDRLRRLEAELGVPLFARTTRRVALSEAGETLLPLAREVLAGVGRLRDAALGPGRKSAFELTLGTRHELGSSWLCPLLRPLERAHPERTLHLYVGDSPDLLLRLERGEIDAMVTSVRLTSPRLSYAALHAETYELVATRRCLSRPSDARELVLVDVSADLPLFRYFLDALPDASPWPFSRHEYLGGIGLVRQRLLDAPGRVAVLPSYFIQKDLRSRRLVRQLPRARIHSDAFRLVWRVGHPQSAELLGLAEELRRHPLS